MRSRSSAGRTRDWPTSRRCCTRRRCRSRGRRCSRAMRRGGCSARLVGDGSTDVAGRVRALAEEAGWLVNLPDKLGERELTRQADLARLVRLAEELDDGERTCDGFAAELKRRFDPGGDGARGVHLLTYHRAKGLEFDAVFLPRLDDKELPSKLARTESDRCRGAAAALRRHDACAHAGSRSRGLGARARSSRSSASSLRRLARPCAGGTASARRLARRGGASALAARTCPLGGRARRM